jgi:uncharacterized small protein (DUF1192 family)
MDTGWLENLLDRQAAGDDEISRLKAELAAATTSSRSRPT